MKHYIFAALLTLGTAVTFTGCGGAQVPIQKRVSATAPCDMTQRQMEQSLIAAARHSNWNVQRMGKGSLQAVRREGDRMAKIAISYTRQKYFISYLDSEGMNQSGEAIDATYNRWLYDLRGRIAKNMPLSCKTMSPATIKEPVTKQTPPQPVQLRVIQPVQEQSVLTPLEAAEPVEEVTTPLMIESVPAEMMIIQ